jgi:hypothetical protein
MSVRERVLALSTGALLVAQLVVMHTAASAQSGPPPVAAVTSATGAGRFQIVVSSHLRADTFLVDTSTGRIWRPAKYTDLKEEPTVWRLETRVDSEKDFQAWWHSYTPKEEKQQ